MAEFGRAAKGGSLFRRAFADLLKPVKGNSFITRLHTTIMKGAKQDTSSARGERNILSGDIHILEGFNCNEKAPLTSVLPLQFTAAADRATGVMAINLPDYVPNNSISAPTGATHYELVMGASAINFTAGTYLSASNQGGKQPLDNNAVPAGSLSCNLPAGGTDPVFLLLGIVFYQELNGAHYIMNNREFNALTIVKVVS